MYEKNEKTTHDFLNKTLYSHIILYESAQSEAFSRISPEREAAHMQGRYWLTDMERNDISSGETTTQAMM